MKLRINKPALSVSTTNSVAYCTLQFNVLADKQDAIDTMNALKADGTIPAGFEPEHGLQTKTVHIPAEKSKNGVARDWSFGFISLRSDDPALVARLRADSSVQKMEALATTEAAPEVA
jgi:hypothetical protein